MIEGANQPAKQGALRERLRMPPRPFCLVLAALGLALALACATSVKEFDAAKYSGQTATIRFSQDFDGDLLFTDGSSPVSWRTRIAQGQATVPAGRLSLSSYLLRRMNSRNAEWQARGWLTGDGIDLQPGAISHVQAGPPFQASVEIKTGSTGPDGFLFSLTGAGGEKIALLKSGMLLRAPKFEILNESGATVFTGQFEYG